jgi:hypothetical protein
MKIDFNKRTQLQMELNRLQHVYRYFYDHQLFDNFQKKSEVEKEFSEEFAKIHKLVFNCERFDESHQSNAKALLERLEMTLCPGVRYEKPPTLEEVKVISQAINAKPGSYFQCKNGHIYNVDKCGGPMETTKCSSCDDNIGGTSHKLLPTNTLAPIDGANEPAYPVT